MSIALALVCDCCRIPFTPDKAWAREGDAHWNSGPDRYTAGGLRHAAKASDWRVQVAGIAPKLRRTQGWRDFCPGCVAGFDAKENKR